MERTYSQTVPQIRKANTQLTFIFISAISSSVIAKPYTTEDIQGYKLSPQYEL